MAGEITGVSASVAERTRAFRERARLEADRYGPDPWIFVRELLQNSRDAGATKVTFTVREGDGCEIVCCRDDGEGMTFAHARRYLFSLYASSKEGDKNQAGKFGVGFWSILRFEPATITIRSKPRDGEGWGIRLDGSLQSAVEVPGPKRSGTEIVLERAEGDGRLEHRVYDAVWQSARYLHLRDDPDRPLPISINGRSANAEFGLGAPSTAFRRGSVRGVVGLGPAPRVELFSRGLRLRSAACLEDLIAPSGRHTARMRVQFPELPGGLAPQALLESDELEVMLSRSDARDNRALARLVRLAQRELERLVDRQLAHARPQPLHSRIGQWFVERLRESMAFRTLTGSLIGALLAVGIGWWAWGWDSTGSGPARAVTPSAPIAVSGLPGTPVSSRPYRDLGARYRGPKIDVLAPSSAEPVELHYTPAQGRLHFAALTFPRLGPDGSPVFQPTAEGLVPYIGARCERDCLSVEIPIDTAGGSMRIPVATGHRIVGGSVRLGEEPLMIYASAEGHPAVAFEGPRRGLLRYQTVAVADPDPVHELSVPESLPKRLAERASRLAHRPAVTRVEALVDLVSERVRYDRSPELALEHAKAQERGEGFIERTLAIGAGDCDVQNSLLVALLHAAKVPARLAVGYVGRDGSVLPWLHAWVEWRDERGQWHVADASDGSALPPPSLEPVATDDVASSGTPQATLEPTAPTPDALATAPRAPAPPGDPPSALGRFLDEARQRLGWAIVALPLLMLGGAAWPLWGTRTRRAIKLDVGADLSRLLQGVLQQPGAFGHVSALFNRPLVPLLDGRAISLNRARELASAGRLYRTRNRPELAKRAIRSGAAVLDAASPEGCTVADALGAVDLDRWSALIDRAAANPLTDGMNRLLERCGEDWCVRISTEVPGGLSVLDVGPLGSRLDGIAGTRLVLMDRTLDWIASPRTRADDALDAAVFEALDQVTERLDLPVDRRARLLAAAARAAMDDPRHP